MRTQYAFAAPGNFQAPERASRSSAVLGTLVMFAALSPMFAVCGFMLAQILGYVAY